MEHMWKKAIYLKLVILIFSNIQSINSKILIITTAFNKPEFIEFQYKTFKKFLKDDYEYLVFNDAIDPVFKNDINKECHKYNIRCFRVPQELHKLSYGSAELEKLLNNHFQAAFRHGDGIYYAFEKFGLNHDDIFVIIDSDVFLTKEFSIREYLGEYEISSITRKWTVWPHLDVVPSAELIFFNVPKLPNPKSLIFKPGFISYRYIDTFQFIQFYLNSNPSVKFKEMNEFTLKSLAKRNNTEDLFKMGFSSMQTNLIKSFLGLYDDHNELNEKNSDRTAFFENSFLNFSQGTLNSPFNLKKIKLITGYLNKIINE